MTVRIIEQQQADGSVKLFAYHAHLVYTGDPENDPDWTPENNNSVVEVMAEVPNHSALSTYRRPFPSEEAQMAQAGTPPAPKVIDVICPDPNCMTVSTYPWNGDPDARTIHAKYALDFNDPERRQLRDELDPNDPDHRRAMLAGEHLPEGAHNPIVPFVANAWARELAGLHPTENHDHLERRDPEAVAPMLRQARQGQQQQA